MNNLELLSDNVGSHFACRVDRLLNGLMTVEQYDYDAASDTCTLTTSSVMSSAGQSLSDLELRIRRRTCVNTVSTYACEKGKFQIVLNGCMKEYKRWASVQLRISNTDRLVYFVLGSLAALSMACFIFYLFHR